ncbi:glycosyltransferase family 2 protein [Chitinophaga pinensis]|uniref:Glycosyl transferase family 2 n=1 Tax=Chitinophaga pinensis (strain ATCC 43595 / DSM 2588 / LMG 13176 / NBRC 15968 / NCIMB 11800 / UQM 2034) TaxID=485918 RepID=A0A979G5H0_CHIPD|nr:glycosyltransferase family 2 protein [Chitinophaga pinensis]ACU61171.1 glycosyl transferase family 2 [Chitinophaga pinensis DSM 2588]
MSQENNIAPLVSIVTVNYNTTAVTCELLHSINGNSYRNVEVIVVDNASKEDPTAALQAAYPAVKVIRSATNKGFAGGNNLGIVAATGEYIFLVNNDTEFTDGLIEGLQEVFQSHPDAGMVSPKFHYYFHKGTIEYAGYQSVDVFTGRNSMIGCKEADQGQYDQLSATNYAHGGGMMTTAAVLKEVGLMPEVYFLYYEEFDWCEQFKRKGYKIYYQYKSLIYHKESMSTGKNSPLKTYYLTRNRILFMRRNVALPNRIIFLLYLTLFTIPKNTLQFLLKREKEHLKAFWKGIMWNVKHRQLNLIPCVG